MVFSSRPEASQTFGPSFESSWMSALCLTGQRHRSELATVSFSGTSRLSGKRAGKQLCLHNDAVIQQHSSRKEDVACTGLRYAALGASDRTPQRKLLSSGKVLY